jgi:DNA-binding NarL/FixJ family response regulator
MNFKLTTAADSPSTRTEPITLYLVDDVPEMRELVRYAVEGDPDFEVVGEAGDGRSAIAGVGETRPAAVIIDLSMPDMNGLEAIAEIREQAPETAIVVLSGFMADRMGEKVLARGADDYVEKGSPLADLREITRRAVADRRAEAGG